MHSNSAALALGQKDLVSLNVLTFNNVFSIVSKNRRAELTKKSNLDPNVVEEISVIKEFRTSSGNIVSINGPLLCNFDAALTSLLVRLFIKGGYEGGYVKTTFSEIIKELQLPRSGRSRKYIFRSLTRLASCSFKIFQDGEPLWSKKIVKEFSVHGSGRSQYIMIELNHKWILGLYQDGKYSKQSSEILAQLKGEYAPAIYRFISSNPDSSGEINIGFLYQCITENDSDRESWFKIQDNQRKKFKQKVKDAIAQLKLLGILHESSFISGDIFFFAHTIDNSEVDLYEHISIN